MFYRPADGHGLPHSPFSAIVSPLGLARTEFIVIGSSFQIDIRYVCMVFRCKTYIKLRFI